MRTRSSKGQLTTGSLLVGIGMIFLLRQTGVLSSRFVWPLLLIVVGISLLIGYLLDQRSVSK